MGILSIGEPAPWFVAPTSSNPKYHFGSVAGRYVLLSFLRSSQDSDSQIVLESIAQHREVFDDHNCCFFGVSTDLEDQLQGRLIEQIPGIRFFWDVNCSLSQQFGVIDKTGHYHSCTYLLDERLRVLAVLPIQPQPHTHIPQLLDIVADLPDLPQGSAAVQAPVLIIPRIFEPELCQALIAYYDQRGGEVSGFMRDVGGKTVQILDSSFKRRQDEEILDQNLRNAAMFRIHDRLVPEIAKAFQFQATRIERHIISCYDSVTGGFFRPHRDNTTRGTAHRRFAVSLNLNTGAYDGGLLRFPEFGRQTYSAPAGGAVVFSCSLLHEATPVTAGRRYAYLPFLYDDAAAQVREQNQHFLDHPSNERSVSSEPQPQNKGNRGFKPIVRSKQKP
ncbi:MAG: 2OG-Fe(II) oxygenase [Leptolyngbya sp. DLM2.Bin15]|nr:MAG: 2OG-Fe(II) oxygenase [Leptolyngbya sp. DLM2.Bin15]